MTWNHVRHFTADEIRASVSWEQAVASQGRAFANLAAGEGSLAPRGLLDYLGGTAFGYLARASRDGWPVVKFGSVNTGNAGLGLPTVHAYVLVLDRETGALCATADGEAITLLRTPAGSIAALEALGDRPDRPGAVAVVGTGLQGSAHREALATICPERELRLISSRSPQAIREGLRGSSTVILATASLSPVVEADWIDAGAIVVSIGAFAPDRMEFGEDLLSRARRVFADDAETVRRQCGPVADALNSGRLSGSSVISIGSVLSGRRETHAAEGGDIVLYASVGLGVQDAAVVDLLMEQTHD